MRRPQRERMRRKRVRHEAWQQIKREVRRLVEESGIQYREYMFDPKAMAIVVMDIHDEKHVIQLPQGVAWDA
jgi:hypothetical protein